jgi:hypothetical protein
LFRHRADLSSVIRNFFKLLNKRIKEINMAQSDAVAARLATYQAAVAQALQDFGNGCYADGVASVASPTGDVTAAQEALDIAAAVAPLNTQIASLQAQDAVDAGNASTAQAALAVAQSSLSDAQAQIVTLQASLASDAAALSGLQSSVAAMQSAESQLQAVIAAVSAIGLPTPASS